MIKSLFRKKNQQHFKLFSALVFVGALLVGYNNCAPQVYSNNQNSSGVCNTMGYAGPTLVVNGQLIPAQNSTGTIIHASVNQNISFSLLANGAPAVCGANNGQSYWVLPTGQQVANNCISQAIAVNGSYVYTYHAVEYINGNDCPPATNNVSVQISIP